MLRGENSEEAVTKRTTVENIDIDLAKFADLPMMSEAISPVDIEDPNVVKTRSRLVPAVAAANMNIPAVAANMNIVVNHNDLPSARETREKGRLSDAITPEMLNMIPEKWHDEFSNFVETGDASEEFFAFHESSKECQDAVDMIIEKQAAALRDIFKKESAYNNKGSLH